MGQVRQAALDAINADVLARYGAVDGEGRKTGVVAEDKLTEAWVYADAQRQAAESIDDAVQTLAKNRYRVGLMVAALVQLHPVELDDLLLRFGQAIAAKDPSRIDGRFSEREQALADPFRG